MQQYHDLMKRILSEGVKKTDRTGTGTISVFGHQMRFNLADGFPVVTTKKLHLRSIIIELLWFLRGDSNITWLKENGCSIWDEWADENGDLGPVYGHQLRNFNSCNIDQLNNAIQSLKTSPDSRRHVITLWNPCQLSEMALPPCYLYFQFFVDRDRLNMHVVQRSGDLFLGIPYDMALFSMLLLYVSKEAGYSPGILDLNIIDAHVYKNQIDAIEEYIETETFELPKYEFNDNKITLLNYKSGPVITAPVAI
jgi:thymidylate synthase